MNSHIHEFLPESETVLWDLWYPEAGATGMSIARGRLNPTDVLWIHAAPPTLEVTVRTADGRVVATGKSLIRSGPRFPMTRLWLDGVQVRREDRWPTAADLGNLVILPGGEVGTLLEWWNAVDGSEWRWKIEFYNHT
jgi:hypothetical protein